MKIVRKFPIFKLVKHLLTYRAIQYQNLQEKLKWIDYFNTVATLTGLIPLHLQQKPKEFLKLLSILRRDPPKRLLEIGTFGGGALYFFARVADPSAKIYSIDIKYPRNSRDLYKGLAVRNQTITLLERDSHDPMTLRRLHSLLDKPLDFIFVDGDHSYEGVSLDYNMYYPLLRERGLMAFHDIHEWEGLNVNKFWKELKSGHDLTEEIFDRSDEWGGIGLLWK